MCVWLKCKTANFTPFFTFFSHFFSLFFLTFFFTSFCPFFTLFSSPLFTFFSLFFHPLFFHPFFFSHRGRRRRKRSEAQCPFSSVLGTVLNIVCLLLRNEGVPSFCLCPSLFCENFRRFGRSPCCLSKVCWPQSGG